MGKHVHVGSTSCLIKNPDNLIHVAQTHYSFYIHLVGSQVPELFLKMYP